MRDHRRVTSCLIALSLAMLTACAKDAAVATPKTQPPVTIDRAPLPDRYTAPLPSTALGMTSWATGDPELPPVGHVIDLLLSGEPAMLSAVETSSTGVIPVEADGWVSVWREALDLRAGTPAFCAAVRPIMAGERVPVRDALAGAFAATCREPQDLALTLRADTPYWAVIEAYQTDFSEHSPPSDGPPLIRAAQQASAATDDGEVWRAMWTLADRPEPEAGSTMRDLHAHVADRERADRLAMAFFRTRDPELHAIAQHACVTLKPRHALCDSGPNPRSSREAPEAPAPDPAVDIVATQKKLAEIGFPHVVGADAQQMRSADATAVLMMAGHVTSFDAETDRFPNEHDSALRALAPLVRPALTGAVFEEVFPTDEDDAYQLIAYLDGKRYHTPARNLGDWYDVEAMLRLLNTMLVDRDRVERFASLHTDDQTAWIVGGPQPAITSAFATGVLQPGDAGSAEQSGKAFEEVVRQRFSQ